MNKRGQFYLIAAMLIIAIILGLNAVSNYLNQKSNVRLEDLRKELKIEAGHVLDYGVVSGDDELDDFTRKYSDYAGDEFEIYFITGEAGGIEAYKYVNDVKTYTSVTEENNLIIAEINDVDYEFELNDGVNFYFVISQKVGGDTYVVSG